MSKVDVLLELARRGLLNQQNLEALQMGSLSGLEREDKLAGAIDAMTSKSEQQAADLAKLVRALSDALKSQKAPQVSVNPTIKVDAPKEPQIVVEANIQPADCNVSLTKPRIKMLHMVRDEWGELIGFKPEYES